MARIKKNIKKETVTNTVEPTEEKIVAEEFDVKEVTEETPIKEEVAVVDIVDTDKEEDNKEIENKITKEAKEEENKTVSKQAYMQKTKYIFGYTWNGLTFDD